ASASAQIRKRRQRSLCLESHQISVPQNGRRTALRDVRQRIPATAGQWRTTPALLFSLVPDESEQLPTEDAIRRRMARPSGGSRHGSREGHRRHDLPGLWHHVCAAPFAWPVLLAKLPAARLAAASAPQSASTGGGGPGAAEFLRCVTRFTYGSTA